MTHIWQRHFQTKLISTFTRLLRYGAIYWPNDLINKGWQFCCSHCQPLIRCVISKRPVEIIKPSFSNIEIFSQRNISKMEQLPILNIFDNILSKIKSSSKKILDRVDKKQNFYKLHLQKTALQLREKRKNISKKVFDIGYVPLPFDESHNPITFLLVCKK